MSPGERLYKCHTLTPQSIDWSYQPNEFQVSGVRRSSECINAIENGCNSERVHTMDVVFMEVLMRSASRYVFRPGMWADKQRDDCRSVGAPDSVYVTVAQGNTAN